MDWMPEGPDYPTVDDDHEGFKCTPCKDTGIVVIVRKNHALVHGCKDCTLLRDEDAVQAVLDMRDTLAETLRGTDEAEFGFDHLGTVVTMMNRGPA